VLRVVNAVIAPDLTETFALSPDHLGLLTGAYFLSFAAAQQPLGIVLDRYGSRRTEAVLLLFAAAGAGVFATAEGFAGLLVGRALIGFGVSACLMAAFRAFVVWFPRDRLPAINGAQMAAGGLGALAATRPVQWALEIADWGAVFWAVAVLTVICAVLLLAMVPDDRPRGPKPSARALIAGAARIFASGLFRRVAPLTVASQASFLAIQGLWTGPWLATVEGLSRGDAGGVQLAIAAAMIAGFLVMGWVAARLARLGLPPFATALAGMALFMMAQAVVLAGPYAAPVWPWLAFGFFGTTGILPYAALSQRFPAALAGRVNTALNVVVFVAAFAAQWGIGGVIKLWGAAGGSAADGHRAAFALLLGCQILGLAWFAFYRRADVPAE
jgi:predicted MFS family arabinose efflux permease